MKVDRIAAVVAIVLASWSGATPAQDRRDDRPGERQVERQVERRDDRGGNRGGDRRGGPGPSYRFEDRYAHDRAYPRRGVYVQALPPGSASFGWRGDRFFFRSGVWYRPEGGRFVVISPPPGIVVPLLPPSYATVYAGNDPYYYANGVYYGQAPGQGYVVVDPPPGLAYGDAPQGAPVAPYAPQAPQAPSSPGPQGAYAPPGAQAASEPIVYPRNGQPPQQTTRDRDDCGRWSSGQAGASPDPSVYQRAFEACMDGRGYTVR